MLCKFGLPAILIGLFEANNGKQLLPEHSDSKETNLPPKRIFSERELMFTFAIIMLSPVRLSYACNARAPYSGG